MEEITQDGLLFNLTSGLKTLHHKQQLLLRILGTNLMNENQQAGMSYYQMKAFARHLQVFGLPLVLKTLEF